MTLNVQSRMRQVTNREGGYMTNLETNFKAEQVLETGKPETQVFRGP